MRTPASTEYVLEIRNLNKAFKSAIALADLSLAVRPGEIHVVLGENGAGKTTLAKTLAGLHPIAPGQGQILVGGQPLVLRSPQDAIRAGIAVVVRRLSLFDQLTVAENVTIGRLRQHSGFLVSARVGEQEARRVMNELGLKLDLHMPAARLSPGQKRMVMIARALFMEPRITVLDEPASFLSTPAEISHLYLAVRTLIEKNIACLYLTRRPSEALQLADRVSVLRDGSIAGEWDRADMDEATLVMSMLSQRYGDSGYVDYDDMEEAGGLLGSLRSLFGFGRR